MLISDKTCWMDGASWVPTNDTWRNIGSGRDIRRTLANYRDGSIDVLILSGVGSGNVAAVETKSGKDLGGTEMDAEVYADIRKKLSAKGQILITACHAGRPADPDDKTVDEVRAVARAFGAPVTVTPGWTVGQGVLRTGRLNPGGAASAPWYTVRPDTPKGTLLRDLGYVRVPLKKGKTLPRPD
jgi:hypothetical protein